MAVQSLVVRSGVGSWGDIAHLITRGLDIGAMAAVWTDSAAPVTSWTNSSNPTSVWSDVTPPSTTWT